MKNIIALGFALLLQGALVAASFAAVPSLTPADLTNLVRPIALYPDMLLTNILPASTFPDQIVDAALLIKTKEDAAKIKDQSWDKSVKVISSYPGVLKMMYEKMDWTTDLGEAFLHQNREVLDAIQTVRLEAQKNGALKTTDQQQVVTEQKNGDTIIQIQPTDPEVVYVPSETTTVVSDSGYYSSSSALVPLATFGVGLALGAALDDDDDYYYGGWGGPAFWYDEAPVNHWLDNRRAAWEDHNDRAWDRQDFRQDQRSDRQDFRQDMYEQGKAPSKEQMQDFRNQQKTERKDAFNQRNPDAASRVQARQNTGGGSFSRSTTGSSANFSRNMGSGSLPQNTQARSTGTTPRGWSTSGGLPASRSSGTVSRGWSSGSNPSASRSAFQGYGSRSSTTAMSSRGYGSRAAAGHYGGGGGFRGGGGGFRGGGGRGRR